MGKDINKSEKEIARLKKKLDKREEQHARALKVQSALFRIANTVSSVKDLQAFYAGIHKIISDLMYAENFYIVLYDSLKEQVEFTYFIDTLGDPKPPTGTMAEYAQAPSMVVFRTREALHKAKFEKAKNPKHHLEPIGTEAVDWVGVPLIDGDETLGVLVVQSYEDNIRYASEDVEILSFVAQHIATALKRAQALEQTHQREIELKILNSIQEGLASRLDIRGIFELVGNRITEIFAGHTVSLFTYDDATHTADSLFLMERGERITLEPGHPGVIFKHTSESRKPLMVSTRKEFYDLGAKTIPGTAQSLSGIFAPLIVGDKVIGGLSIQSTYQEYAFNDSDLRLVTTIANSMSVALENVRLFDKTTRLLKETEKQNAELTIINTIQRALAAELDIRGIYEAIGKKLREIFDYQTVAIYSANLEKSTITSEYVFEKGESFEPIEVPFNSLYAYVIKLNDTFVKNGDFPEFATAFDDYIILQGEMPKSILAVPVPRKKEVDSVVILTLQDMDGKKTFSGSDIRLLETVANAMGIALENASLFDETQRLFKAEQQRATELQIVNRVSQALTRELDLQSLIDLVGDTLRRAIHTDSIGIGLFDHLNNQLQIAYAYKRGVRIHPQPAPLNPFTLRVAKQGTPLVINKNTQRIWNRFGSNLTFGEELPKSVVMVPILAGKTLIGGVTIQDFEHEHAYSRSTVRLLETVASNMGTAIQNARLFDETQRLLEESQQRAAELAIINSVQEGLSSKLEVQAIYELVGNQIRDIFDAQVVTITHIDHGDHTLQERYIYEDGEIHPPSSPVPIRNSAYEELLLQRKTPVIWHTSEEAEILGLKTVPGTNPALSGVIVPLLIGGQTIGTLSLQNLDHQDAFGDSDVRLLTTLANSMSVALENARLFEAERKRTSELFTINTISQALVTETEPDALIQLIGEQIRHIFSADIVYVALLERKTDLIHFPYTYGEDFATLPLGKGLTSHIIQNGEPLLINREMEKRRAELGTELVGKRASSYLGVPIKIGMRTFGVISVQSTQEEDIFDEEDLHLLSTIAANVGTALRNTSLFDEIRTQKQYYQAVIEHSPAAIVLLDSQATVTGWNPAAEKLFGYPEDEAIGKNIDDLVANTPELRSEAINYSHQALREKNFHVIAKRTRKDGSFVDVEISALPVVVDGQQKDFIAIYHDITELQRARHAAEAANQAKSAFLANMSHELRTPLNAIIGFTRIVRRKGRGVLGEKQVDNLDKVLVSAEHLLGLINTILDISKIEAGRMEVQASTFELSSLLKLVTTTIQPLIKPGVRLISDIPSSLPVLYSDQDKIKQILINLLSNAGKFTSEGQITLEVREDGELLHISVRDTGIGISEQAIGRIFEEFQQADSSTTRQYGGTGLGLSISRSLARLLGGDIHVTSVEGEGSTFKLTIPFNCDPRLAAQNAFQPDSAPQELGEDPIILVIDDNQDTHNMLKQNLGDAGYCVSCAFNGDEGIRQAHELQPFAIILDVMMPDKDGWQVLHELKTDPHTQHIPVVLFTIVDKKDLGYRLGASEYLVKPLEERAVLKVLERLDKSKGSAAPHRVLVVDDDPDMIETVRKLLEGKPYLIEAVRDGQSALQVIQNQSPDTILLNLLMQNQDRFDLIAELQNDPRHKDIPIIILTAKTLTEDEQTHLQKYVNRIIPKQNLTTHALAREIQTAIANVER